MIPKIIIQTWKTSDLPNYYKKTQELIRRNNPDYDYLFFDDDAIDEFINTRFPEYALLVGRFRYGIQKIDLFRLLAIYEYGGFYFDMDVEVVDSLDELSRYDCVFPVEMPTDNSVLNEMGYSYTLSNYAFGASPKNLVIRNILDEIARLINDDVHMSRYDGEEHIYHTTGPTLVSRVVFESLKDGHDIKLLYPKNWPSRSSWFKFGTYAKHTMTGTWKPDLNKSELSNGSDNSENPGTMNKTATKRIVEGMGKAWRMVGIEGMTNLSDDPESILIICIVSSILMILFVLCMTSLIGCDEGYDLDDVMRDIE